MYTDSLEDIKKEAVNLFSSLLEIENPCEEDSMLDSIPQLVSNNWNNFLLSPFTEEEIKKVDFSLGGDRAMGPNGFPTVFFQTLWHIMGKDVVEIVQEF